MSFDRSPEPPVMLCFNVITTSPSTATNADSARRVAVVPNRPPVAMFLPALWQATLIICYLSSLEMKLLLAFRNFVLLAHRWGRFDGRFQRQNKHWSGYPGGRVKVMNDHFNQLLFYFGIINKEKDVSLVVPTKTTVRDFIAEYSNVKTDGTLSPWAPTLVHCLLSLRTCNQTTFRTYWCDEVSLLLRLLQCNAFSPVLKTDAACRTSIYIYIYIYIYSKLHVVTHQTAAIQ